MIIDLSLSELLLLKNILTEKQEARTDENLPYDEDDEMIELMLGKVSTLIINK